MVQFSNPKMERNAPCWCGSGKKYKNCHMDFDEKLRRYELEGHMVPDRGILKTPEQIAGIRRSAEVNETVLDAVADRICIGMTTEEIDEIVYDLTLKLGGIPAPLHYEGYPKSVCTSINEEVCHGIPDTKHILRDGDIINVDCTTIYDGFYADSSRMFLMGDVSPEKRKLVEVTRECIDIGLSEVIPWHFLGDMADKINQHAIQNGYSVVREIGGHGCGVEFHEDPFVSFVSEPGTEMLMVPGMVFTIEPMINMGTNRVYQDDKNGWTIYTEDGKPSAQWEIQVLVTETGHEILTNWSRRDGEKCTDK